MRSTFVCFFIALILVTLGACLPATPEGDLSEVIVDPNPIIAEDGLTPRERNIKALGFLGQGKAKEARVELKASLDELPASKNSRAQNLISQIDGDPVDMLGSENFKYKVAKGETLSIIAQRYLGDPLNFYVLARYNDMDNPSQVQHGDVIKVPGKKPTPIVIDDQAPIVIDDQTPIVIGDQAPIVIDDQAPIVTDDQTQVVIVQPPVPDTPTVAPPEPGDRIEEMDLLAEAGAMVDAGNYGGAIIHLEKGMAAYPDTKLIMDYSASVYVKLGEKLSGEHKYEEARSALQQAAILDPENKEISGRLAKADQAARSDSLYREGQNFKDRKAVIDAYESYQAALKVWPDHDRAQIELAKIRPQAADIYYREGRTAFQRHDLKEALGMYDKTLEVYSNHEPAKLDRQRTIELLDKIKDIPAAGEQNSDGQNTTSN